MPKFPTIRESFSILREQREPQMQMAELVDRCIRENLNGLCEAGTGTGKSFGYALPVVAQGRRALVSTGTIALQEQLIRYDVPFLEKTLRERFGIHFRGAMLKGASNYLCARRYDEVGVTLSAEVSTWCESTTTGDLSEAPTMPPEDRDSIRIDLDDCGRQSCPFWEKCHYQEAKRRFKAADLGIVNHKLLTMGLGEPFGLDLSGYDVLVIDEAHQFEEYARDSFSGKLSPVMLSRFFQAVESHVVPKDDEDRLAWDERRAAFSNAWKRVLSGPANATPWYAKQHPTGAPFDDEEILIPADWVREHSKAAGEALAELASWVAPRLVDEAQHNKIRRQMDAIKDFFVAITAGDVIAVAERKLRDNQPAAAVTIKTFPLYVGERLKRHLYPAVPVIFTSATISAGGDFGLVKQGLGLAPTAPELEVASPFDYPNQSLLYIPREPRFDGKIPAVHGPAVRDEIERLLALSQGRAFVLFTSKGPMRDAFNARRHDFPSRLQENDANKNELIAWFKSTPNAVLYATASFWEGVSIEGEALSLVIIDKIPFPPPSDPVFRAKEARMPEGKGFSKLSVPAAIIKLKQGFGRLIRTQTDRGMVAILDSRIHGKPSYGRRILGALPPATLITDLTDQALIARYLSGPLSAPAAAPLAVGGPQRAGEDSSLAQLPPTPADEPALGAVTTVVIQDDAHLAAILDAAEAIPADATPAARQEAARAALVAVPLTDAEPDWDAISAWASSF